MGKVIGIDLEPPTAARPGEGGRPVVLPNREGADDAPVIARH
jgi:hypothetical protein